MNENKKRMFTVSIILLVIVVIYATIVMSQVKVTEKGIVNSGMYSINLTFDNIKEVKLEDTISKGLIRTNGIDLIAMNIGRYKNEKGEKLKLFVYSSKGPYIYIKPKNSDYDYVILNYRDKEKTEKVFNEINGKIKPNNP